MRTILFIAIVVFFSAVYANKGTVVDNGDGTFKYTQLINASSKAPYYTKPSSSGFGVYAYYNKDYGWQHDFPEFNTAGLNITSAKLTITAYDVDSEVQWGTEGEYDGISVDGNALNPGLLQGENNKISTTVFDIPVDYILDDGKMNTFLDIDMTHEYDNWATRLDESKLVISYTFDIENSAPFKPELSALPTGIPSESDDLVINVTGPDPADENGDEVTYNYRWFVDVGQGYLVDDEFAGKTNHKGNTVPANQLKAGEIWAVEVTAVDSNGVVSSSVSHTWEPVTNDKDGDGVEDIEDDFPDDSQRAFESFYPASNVYNTLFFEDTWPKKGDFDFNDLAVEFNYTLVSDSSNKVKDLILNMKLIAKGASEKNGLAVKFDGIKSDSIESSEISINNGAFSEVPAESGHTDDTVMLIVEDTSKYMPGKYPFAFYNTEDGDGRDEVPAVLKITFASSVIDPGDAPFDIFIYKTDDRGREIHLRNQSPTEKADSGLFKTEDDASNKTSVWYVTSGNLPWAVEISGSVVHPVEKTDFTLAYPQVTEWAQTSGVKNRSWYLSPVAAKIWKKK